MKDVSYVKNQFKKYFPGFDCVIVESKGRFEILGNHTDHNHGLCLSSDCNLKNIAAVKENGTNIINFISHGYKPIKISIDDLKINPSEYKTSKAIIKGVIYYLKSKKYKIGGFNCYCYSQIPIGSGLSSSASFEILIANIISILFNNNKIDNLTKAYAGQYAENKYYLKACGLLDQISIAFPGIKYINFYNKNKPKITLLNDDILSNIEIVIIKSNSTHEKLENLYEEIPNNMYRVAGYFHKQFLGQISYKKYQENISKFSDREISVCNHFYQENKRVKKGLKAIENNDVDTLFECIDNSAKSNQNNLKNSQIGDIYIDSLQNIIDFSKNILHNEIAIKLTGGGFAGACIAFIKNNKLKILKKAIKNSNKNWEIIPLK